MHFDLEMCFAPQRRALFRQVVRTWCVLYILTSKCASRHKGVHFFISHLASWLHTRRFSEPTFRPSGAPNHWKNSVSRLSYLFAHLPLLSSNLPLLSASSLLCISSVHIVGSLASKLPSINHYYGSLLPSFIFLYRTHIFFDADMLPISSNQSNPMVGSCPVQEHNSFYLSSSKHLYTYRQSPCLIGKSSIAVLFFSRNHHKLKWVCLKFV